MKAVSKLLICLPACMVLICCWGISRSATLNEKYMQTVAEGNNAFGLNLLHQIGDETANVFFSPYSMYGAMAMAIEGARKETASEMGMVMGLPDMHRRSGGETSKETGSFAPLHKGLSSLNEKLVPAKKSDNELLQRIDRLKKDLNAAGKKMDKLLRRHDAGGEEYERAVEEEHRIVTKYNQAVKELTPYELNIANALWVEKTYPLSPAYINTLGHYYNTGGAYPADFKTGFPGERIRINSWIAENTNQRIKDIIPRLSPGEAQLLKVIITNAVFFKGEWEAPFPTSSTALRPFYLTGGEKIMVPTMVAKNYETAGYAAFNEDGSFFDTPRHISQDNEDTAYYPAESGFAMLEIPYKGERISMIVIRPNSNDGLSVIEQKLDSENLDEWVGKIQYRDVHVYLPTFKLETGYDMKKYLEKLGMRRAFKNPLSPEGANFGGMCDSADPMKQLYITKFLHKAFVEVNEKGTEAAAATAVMMGVTSAYPLLTPFIPTFKADRPFIFIIRDKVSGTMLFLGRMAQPDVP